MLLNLFSYIPQIATPKSLRANRFDNHCSLFSEYLNYPLTTQY